jgi:hypothetical protein
MIKIGTAAAGPPADYLPQPLRLHMVLGEEVTESCRACNIIIFILPVLLRVTFRPMGRLDADGLNVRCPMMADARKTGDRHR